MPDIIEILPDSVANQIAAGEVVQRPASVVKELLENAVDAGASKIILNVKDSGRTLIQVIDNGKGMSDADARMCFERHATSKIKLAEDLFTLQTKGFRGEALASIAAVAHVELKTRLQKNEIGTHLILEGSEVVLHEPTACQEGSIISVKNLFFNIPARRKFLKSDAIEMKHIMEEFQRVALTHPAIYFQLFHNEQELFRLTAGGFKQRILGIFGDKFNERLVPVNEETSILNITGFIGKPEFAKKNRGEQYIFVNNRYIRNNYLNHAIQLAYEDLLPSSEFPSYFLLITIAPDKIDININPTKTEIKFDDEKSVYAIVRTAVKQSLGKYQISPVLDFERETSFDIPINNDRIIKQPTIKTNPNYNPFSNTASNSSLQAHSDRNRNNWEFLLNDLKKSTTEEKKESELNLSLTEEKENIFSVIQLNNTYLITTLRSGLLIIDQQRAHERILYEQFLNQNTLHKKTCQQLMFPETIELSSIDSSLLKSVLSELNNSGFDIAEFGNNTFVINGLPPEMEPSDTRFFIENFIDDIKMSSNENKNILQEKIAKSASKILSVKKGKAMHNLEMKNLLDNLFACEQPNYTPSGKTIFVNLPHDEIAKKF
jgi:DNA mismatch repair protein MutL